MRGAIYLKRIYDPAEPGDGWRVLVDGLWPRGVRKAGAAVDCWAKDVAPSRALRRWYKHEPARWPAFRDAYLRELAASPAAVAPLLDAAQHGPVTLLFAARDRERNNAVVLREHLLAALDGNAGG